MNIEQLKQYIKDQQRHLIDETQNEYENIPEKEIRQGYEEGNLEEVLKNHGEVPIHDSFNNGAYFAYSKILTALEGNEN